MADFPSATALSQPVVIGAHQLLFTEFANVGSLNATTGAWPTSNLAIFVPLPLSQSLIATQLFVWNGGTVSGNIDVGIYTREGALVISAGSTAQTGTSVAQLFDITDTLLNSGLYYLAVVQDNTTGIIDHMAPSAVNARMMGCLAATSAFPLPATVTFSALAAAYVPGIHLTTQTVV